jgi:hypothetical protein
MAPIWDYFGYVILFLLFITVGSLTSLSPSPSPSLFLVLSLPFCVLCSPVSLCGLISTEGFGMWRLLGGQFSCWDLHRLIDAFPTKAGAIHVPLD